MKTCFAILLTAALLLSLTGCSVENRARMGAQPAPPEAANVSAGVIMDEAIKIPTIGGKGFIGSDKVTTPKVTIPKATEETTEPTEKIKVCKVCCNTLTECETCEGKGDCGDCLKSGKHKDPTVDLCDHCAGSGYEPGKSNCISCMGRGRCNLCKGKEKNNCISCKGSGKCGFCKGTGKWGFSSTKCKTCDGKGAEKLIDCPNDGNCADCEGTGLICQDCLEKKKAEEEKKKAEEEKKKENNSKLILPQITINKKETTPARSCGRCGGSGGISCYNCRGISCANCGGDGYIYRMNFIKNRMEIEMCGMCFGKACLACGGSGYRDCPDC